MGRRANKQTDRQRQEREGGGGQIDRETDRDKRDREGGRRANRQTDRQRQEREGGGGQIDRETDRDKRDREGGGGQTDRQKESVCDIDSENRSSDLKRMASGEEIRKLPSR